MNEVKVNPDILDCLANLSADEVFTPPKIANEMLNLLPEELFKNPKIKFLDPFTKSGVFLREITKRLDRGLESVFPNRNERIKHILTKQVFGIAITELTSLFARRSLYCNKEANSEFSPVRDYFDTAEGNIKYIRSEHNWINGKCSICGIAKKALNESMDVENYAYPFLHNEEIMKTEQELEFDVVIGNPPYHMKDYSGGSDDSAEPLYNIFLEKAKSINPKHIIMIIPSRWMVGGRSSLNKFREEMLSEHKIKYICDYEDSSQCFDGVHLDGGVMYFHWMNNYEGKVNYNFINNKGDVISSERFLANNYSKYVVRDNRLFSILEKVLQNGSFSSIVSSTKPFGIRNYLFNDPSRYPNSNLSEKPFDGSVKIYGVKGIKGGAKRCEGYINKAIVTDVLKAVEKYKIFFTTSYSTNAINPPAHINATPGEVCTETFIVIGPFNTEEEMLNCSNYIKTNFFKFFLYQGKGTMQVSKEVFCYVPLQDFSKPWTDEELYKKYNLTADEIKFIESMIKPMN